MLLRLLGAAGLTALITTPAAAQYVSSGMQPLEVDWTPALYAAPALIIFLVVLLRWRFSASEALCGGCRHNDPAACRKPERPEARRCADFEAA